VADPSRLALPSSLRSLPCLRQGPRLLGALLPLAYASPIFASYRAAIAVALGDPVIPGSETARLVVGITGGSIAGKWMAHWAVVRWGVRARRRWALQATVASLLTWFVVDSISSLIAGAWANVAMVNLLPLLVVGPLVWRLAPSCDQPPSPPAPGAAGPARLAFAVALVGIASGLMIAFALDSGLLGWAVTDSAWSLASRGAFNVWMVNLPVVVLAGAPLLRAIVRAAAPGPAPP